MNSINGVGSLGSLCNVSGCNTFAPVRPQEENSIPEQHDMVSLGQSTSEQGLAFQNLVCDSESSPQVAQPSRQSVVAKSSTSVNSNSVDAGNGLRATMSDLGVLTLLDDSAIASLDQVSDVASTDLASQQNTLAMINLNSMDSILEHGLVSM